MEVSCAKALRDAWKCQGDAPCPHTRVDAESTASGYFTGHYVCKTCGEYVEIQHHATMPGDPVVKRRTSWGRYAFFTSIGLAAAAVPLLSVWYKRRRRGP